MKIKKALFKNFRLLKDLTLDFSTDPIKKLTVIRAANETGKTTCQTALLWGFFGRDAFPKRSQYILSPKDQVDTGSQKINIEVWIEFQIDEYSNVGKGKTQVSSVNYRIIRTAIEVWKGREFVSREGENALMFRITDHGTESVSFDEQKRVINSALPVSLKDVYFTDGDAAMAFIEAGATQGVKRARVGNAIQALLGINVLERTLTHLNSIASAYNSEVGDTDYQREAEEYRDKIESYSEDILEAEERISQNKLFLKDSLTTFRAVETEIEELLKKGDKEKLASDLKTCAGQIDRLTKEVRTSGEKLGDLIGRDQDLATLLVKDVALKGFSLLDSMSKDNLLPKVNIPIIQDILNKRDFCFCGSDVRNATDEGKKRRESLLKLIEESRESDAKQQAATSIYYSSGNLNFEDCKNIWDKKYSDLILSNTQQIKSLEVQKSNYADLDAQIRQIDDQQLRQRREQKDTLKHEISILQSKISTDENVCSTSSQKRTDTETLLRRLESKVSVNDAAAARLRSSRLVQDVFESVVKQMKDLELTKVSDEMNKIFLSMIGSSPKINENTIINGAQLTKEYDIKVKGPRGNSLDPDVDLNGASRRAITMAFILALTKVSSVEAPNVIDTPLGMMSGYVKQSVFLSCIEEGSQLIMFLTHDEIREVEKIIDKYAGKVYTLTNPAHYPSILVNEPDVDDTRILRCECSHREYCSICERREKEMVE